MSAILNASQLYHAHLASLGDVDTWVSLFATDGVLEYPFSESIGYPVRLIGHDQIRGFVEPFLASVTDFVPVHPRVLLATDTVVVADHRVKATMVGSGRSYPQRYLTYLTAEAGKITLLAEYLDNVVAARALLPDGLASLHAQVS